jgi:hypothetical protein
VLQLPFRGLANLNLAEKMNGFHRMFRASCAEPVARGTAIGVVAITGVSADEWASSLSDLVFI